MLLTSLVVKREASCIHWICKTTVNVCKSTVEQLQGQFAVIISVEEKFRDEVPAPQTPCMGHHVSCTIVAEGKGGGETERLEGGEKCHVQT